MDAQFDLLGDPIPAGRGKRGRPQHLATAENQRKVMLLMGLGWPNTRIASAIGITVPTLIKNYFTGLGRRDRLGKMVALRAQAKDRLEAVYHARVWAKAMDGDVSALRLMGQILDRNMGLQAIVETAADEDDDAPLGKKERAQREAADIPEGWGAVLGETRN